MKNATFKQSAKLLSIFEDTPAEQIQAILGSGILVDLRDGDITKFNRDEFRRMVDLEPLTPMFLELISTVVVPPTTGQFIAKEKFVKDTGHKAKVKISYIGDNFKEWFLDGSGKIEELIIEETILNCHKLCRAEVDAPIIAELGGEAMAETTLTQMFSLMEKQASGEAGVLLNNGYANIFYIKDISGALCAVRVDWCGGGWVVGATTVGFPYGWLDGYQVFSRNSVLKSLESGS